MNKIRARMTRPRLSTLLTLVVFVFFILLVTMIITSCVSYLLIWLGILSATDSNELVILFLFVLLFSVVLGTALTSVTGRLFMRPISRMITATSEIANGNFDVRVDASGTEEMKRLAEGFNNMAMELGSVETMRSDFVSNISHEFKTPVVSIRGFARLLKKGDISQEQREEYLDIIISESERLTRLSSSVLLLSKLDSTDNVYEREVFSLDEQLRRVILMLQPQIEKSELALTVNLMPVKVKSNAEMLQHVWINIISNAVKFSSQNGSITISLAQTGGEAVATIEDMGVGMDEEVQRHIFDKFYQGDKSRSVDGNGLGLALAKRIVELCGGTIEVESEPDFGSVFTVRLPAE